MTHETDEPNKIWEQTCDKNPPTKNNLTKKRLIGEIVTQTDEAPIKRIKLTENITNKQGPPHEIKRNYTWENNRKRRN